eukprot:2559115-Amphidinium_carterae.1
MSQITSLGPQFLLAAFLNQGFSKPSSASAVCSRSQAQPPFAAKLGSRQERLWSCPVNNGTDWLSTLKSGALHLRHRECNVQFSVSSDSVPLDT